MNKYQIKYSNIMQDYISTLSLCTEKKSRTTEISIKKELV